MFTNHYIFYLIIIAIGFLIGLYKYNINKGVRPVIILLGVTLISETLSKILAYTISQNVIVYHFFNPIQAIIWASFFYINTNSWVKKFILPSTILLLLFAIFNSTVLQGLESFPGNFIKLETLLLLFWSFHLFLELLDRPTNENIFFNPIFVISIAVIWFNLFAFPFFELYNFLLYQKLGTDIIHNFNYFSNYTYYSLLAFAMIINKTKKYSHVE